MLENRDLERAEKWREQGCGESRDARESGRERVEMRESRDVKEYRDVESREEDRIEE